MSKVTYVCCVCRRILDPEKEEIHVYPNGEVYCGHCHSELKRWLGGFGLDMVKEP